MFKYKLYFLDSNFEFIAQLIVGKKMYYFDVLFTTIKLFVYMCVRIYYLARTTQHTHILYICGCHDTRTQGERYKETDLLYYGQGLTFTYNCLEINDVNFRNYAHSLAKDIFLIYHHISVNDGVYSLALLYMHFYQYVCI